MFVAIIIAFIINDSFHLNAGDILWPLIASTNQGKDRKAVNKLFLAEVKAGAKIQVVKDIQWEHTRGQAGAQGVSIVSFNTHRLGKAGRLGQRRWSPALP